MKINITKLIPKEWTIENIDGDKVKVYYINKGRGNSPKPMIFPNFIEIDERFMEGVGLFLGDGDMNRKDKCHLTYASKDKDIAKHALDFLIKRFYLNTKDISFNLVCKNINQEDEKKWKTSLDLLNKKICVRTSDRHNKSCMHIQVNSIIFRILFEKIVDNSLKINYIQNKNLRISLLRGLFAAEGNVSIMRTEGKDYINQITFSLHLEEGHIIKIITDILDFESINCRVNIRIDKTTKEIHISNWRNYKKLWDINLFDLCERKKKEFVRILNNLKVFCFLNEAELENIFESFEMSQSKIAKEWGVCHSIISAIKNNKRKITFPELFYLSKSTKILGKLEGIRIANSTCFENNSENKEFIEYIHKIKEAMFSYSSICQAST